MNRRTLFRSAAAVLAALPFLGTRVTEASEYDRIDALVQDVLANPGKHPEIEARAREYMGGMTGVSNLTVSGNAAIASFDPEAAAAEEAERQRQLAEAHGRAFPNGAPMFEAMQSDCAALGCSLGRAVLDGNAVYAHAALRFDGVAYGVSYANHADLARLDAWRRSLHVEG